MTGHTDIRIGTILPGDRAPALLPQVIPHGFESFQIMFWKHIPTGLRLADLAKQVRAVLEEVDADRRPVISSLGVFGNPLEDKRTAKDWGRCVDACHLFGCAMVVGFAGRLTDKPVPESMTTYRQVFQPVAKRAADKGVRLAFENCDMGGDWERGGWNIAHAPKAWDMMFDVLPAENVGLEWEPCHQMNSLVDPLPQLREWLKKGKVFHMHGKDATIDWHALRTHGIRGGVPYVWHRTPGFGDTNWTDVISILRQHKYTGTIDIEGHHDPVYRDELEWTGQVHALNHLKQCRGGDFVPNPK